MNALDFGLIAIVVLGALFGLKIGLIGAAFNAVGVYFGWVMAGQYSDNVGDLFADSVNNDTVVTVVSYGIIIIIALAVANLVSKFVRPLLTVFTLGLSKLVDRLGGLALGLLFGVAIAGAVIIVLARFTYDFDSDIIAGVVPGRVAENVSQVQQQLARVNDVRADLEDTLTESKLVSVFIDVTDAIPANAFGFVSDDFKVALDFLEVNIE